MSAAAKLLRSASPLVVWLAAAGLEAAHVETGWMVIDEFAARFVFFYSGYLFADRVFALARGVASTRVAAVVAALAMWAGVNAMAVSAGYSRLPVVSLGLGLAGAMAVVATGALMARYQLFAMLRYCGENSLVIYLAFFVFMAATRMAMLKAGLVGDVGIAALVVTAAGVAGPLLLDRLVRSTPARFVFMRPAALSLGRRRPAGAARPVAAE